MEEVIARLLTSPDLIDTGFIILVCIACWSALKGNSSDIKVKPILLLKKEIEDLKSSLEVLVHDASAASAGLDRSLRRRQEELRELIIRAESIDTESLASRPAPEASPAETSTASSIPADQRIETIDEVEDFDDDLPNASWSQPMAKPAPEERSTVQPKHSSPKSIDERIKEAVEVTRAEQHSEQQPEPQKEETLKVKRPSQIDPVAYKVAKRLIERGEEIHVVSRKLELSLSQVRLIEKEVRGTNSEPETFGEAAEKEIEALSTKDIEISKTDDDGKISTSLGDLNRINRESAIL